MDARANPNGAPSDDERPKKIQKSFLSKMLEDAKKSEMEFDENSMGNRDHLEKMSDAQLDVFSVTMQREYFQEVSKSLVYAELLLLCVLSISSQL